LAGDYAEEDLDEQLVGVKCSVILKDIVHNQASTLGYLWVA